jgi:hypothetical protein
MTLMFSKSQLTEEQAQALHTWAQEGASIADLQRKLGEEFNLKITYMDARLLVLDLGITLREEKPEAPVKVPDLVPQGDGTVTVTVDEITVPGSLVSGRVTFGDGMRALWYLDQMGRLGLDPDQPGYRPSEPDLKTFQDELRLLMQGA